MPSSDDPTVVRTVAVTASDVVSAYEARTRSDRRAVLRITPPFSGRMRARIHVADRDAYDESTGPQPVHIDPRELLADAPPYPEPDDVEDALRADSDVEYTTERHRERYTAAVEDWRERARKAIAGEVTVETPEGEHRVDVSVLGA